ncbi:MAG: hypothetical protein IPK58_04480 [Acidobacteria bacterium]|nr:hypothetical protein [Acidobacteriota bacterium]
MKKTGGAVAAFDADTFVLDLRFTEVFGGGGGSRAAGSSVRFSVGMAGNAGAAGDSANPEFPGRERVIDSSTRDAMSR